LAHVAHGVDVLRGNRLFQPDELERLDLLGKALGRRQVVAGVHIDGQLDRLGQRLPHEGHLVGHVVDLGVVGSPVDTIEA
jgi:hypothetical protein